MALLLGACLKQRNEIPGMDNAYDPALEVNFLLNELNALVPAEGLPVLIDSDWTISCVVRADDESGNMHNQLIIEDSTGGIALLLNEASLYARYPIGRKLYVHLKGLYLGNYHGTPQLGAAPAPDNAGLLQVSSVRPKYFSQYIVTAAIATPMPALSINMNDLSKARKDLTNRLIRISDVEIANPDYDNSYAEPAAATSIKLQNCDGVTILLRSSNYAHFQSYPTPFGKGTINAVYTIYNGVGQLTIRDTGDLQMNAARCDGSYAAPASILAVDSLRKMYHGKDLSLGNYKIRGIVTSDVVNKNFGNGNIILQNEAKAIMIYLGTAAANIPELGDSIELNLAGSILTSYNGALEIKNIKSSKVILLGKDKVVKPVRINLAALNADFANYESVLVEIVNAKITTSGNFSGNKTLNDGTGTIILYTSNAATFAYSPVPLITRTFQAIATPYNTTKELKIRNPSSDIY